MLVCGLEGEFDTEVCSEVDKQEPNAEGIDTLVSCSVPRKELNPIDMYHMRTRQARDMEASCMSCEAEKYSSSSQIGRIGYYEILFFSNFK